MSVSSRPRAPSITKYGAEGKRNRTGSISGRLRAASDLADFGVINHEDKGLVKDLIITEDPNFVQALDRFTADPSDRKAIQDILSASSHRRGSIDLLEGIDFAGDFMGGVDFAEDKYDDTSGSGENSGDEIPLSLHNSANSNAFVGNAGGANVYYGVDGHPTNPESKSRSQSIEFFNSIFSEVIPGGSSSSLGGGAGGHTTSTMTAQSGQNYYSSNLEGLTGQPSRAHNRVRMDSLSSQDGTSFPHTVFDYPAMPKLSDFGPTPIVFGEADQYDHPDAIYSNDGGDMNSSFSINGLTPQMHHQYSSRGSHNELGASLNSFGRNSSVPSFRQFNVAVGKAHNQNTYQDSIQQHYKVDTPAGDGSIGAYTAEERKARIARFMEKRNRRVWTKRVKYDVRKNFADSRIRVKGRFVKKEDENLLREQNSK